VACVAAVAEKLPSKWEWLRFEALPVWGGVHSRVDGGVAGKNLLSLSVALVLDVVQTVVTVTFVMFPLE